MSQVEERHSCGCYGIDMTHVTQFSRQLSVQARAGELEDVGGVVGHVQWSGDAGRRQLLPWGRLLRFVQHGCEIHFVPPYITCALKELGGPLMYKYVYNEVTSA